MKKFRKLVVFTVFLASCDYYDSAMDYIDNAALQQIELRDRLINKGNAPYILEVDGRCFLKKIRPGLC